ncbi:MAG TPA: LLM class F420-dependent oxidoreductase [Acidimicrobiia bacterium]|nr:LLM class F420-dependent oxidoreductase [Acidimicrobiia bacterium]
MRISTLLDYSDGFAGAVDEIVALEKAGLDHVWVPEAYTVDAATAMGFIAARTEKVTIGSGILPIYTRTPSLLAMTAAGLDQLSGGRAVLGLGASGPQVIEGFHGVPYDAPVARISEIIDICRSVWRREALVHEGDLYRVPLPPEAGTGLGKPLKIIGRMTRDRIPIVVAGLGPKSVELTAAKADGWLPAFFVPEHSGTIWGQALARGQANREVDLGELEVYAGGLVAIGDGMESARDLARPQVALYVGGMGARGKNFYNDLFVAMGYGKEAAEVQDLYLSGRKEEAEAAIPDEYLELGNLCGSETFVADRIDAYRAAGVTTLNVLFTGRTAEERVAQCRLLARMAKG